MNAIANLKDNVATAAVMAATLFAILGTAVDASFDHEAAAAEPVQMIDTIVVSAPRVDVKLEPIVVSATR